MRKTEFESLHSLKSNSNIITKEADKGSAIVIQNRADYIAEGLKQLNDRKFYKSVDLDLTSHHNHLVSLQVTKMLESGEINQKCAEYLVIDNPRTANFYLLPKIHKGIIPPPGRPIVSANNCPTECISQFVDHFIQPLVPILKSYVRDSGHLLWILSNITLPSNIILCTLDVSSLYTNIPTGEGIEAVRHALFKSGNPLENPTNHSVCELLKLVLTGNNFQFDNKHFLQIGGTAMGTKLAPSFANIFMGWFEEKYVYSYKTQPLIWKRYIDDMFIIWQHGPNSLTEFTSCLDSCHKIIKFTQERSSDSIIFLDFTISIGSNNEIITSLYSKPNDSHNYLLYSSEHPRHLLKGIPFSQFLRVRRICSNVLDYRQSSLMLASHFIRRGYRKYLVQNAMTRAELKDCDTLLSKNAPDITRPEPPKSKNPELTFYLVTTHNPSNSPIRKIVEENWTLLNKSKTTRTLENAKFIFGLRRNKNLSDLLVRASTRTSSNVIPNIAKNPCNRSSTCRYCPILDTTGHLVSTTNGRKFTTMRKVNCQSSNLIYVITCNTCKVQYVGQTKNRILTRFQGRFNDIAHDRDTTVARHLNRCVDDKNATANFTITVATFIPAPPESRHAKLHRDREEKCWMHRLSTITQLGLNLMV